MTVFFYASGQDTHLAQENMTWWRRWPTAQHGLFCLQVHADLRKRWKVILKHPVRPVCAVAWRKAISVLVLSGQGTQDKNKPSGGFFLRFCSVQDGTKIFRHRFTQSVQWKQHIIEEPNIKWKKKKPQKKKRVIFSSLGRAGVQTKL